MRVEMRLRIVDDDGAVVADDAVLGLEKRWRRVEELGLTLSEAKRLLAGAQERLVAAQAAACAAAARPCAHCGAHRRMKGRTWVRFRTLFGTLRVASPRLFTCPCRGRPSKTFSPLGALFSSHVAPELQFIEAKWGATLSFAGAAGLLRDVLPVAKTTNASTLRNDLRRVAKRRDAALGEERVSYVEGCPAQWADLPRPEGPIVVGLDGGFVRNRDERGAQFEVIAGKSAATDRPDRFFGFVATGGRKPRSRLHDVLRGQRLQANQPITVMTDGADNLRKIAAEMSPQAEHILDWFHIAMRFTVLGQFAKGLAHHDQEAAAAIETDLESAKWRLWNGDPETAVSRLGDVADRIEFCDAAYPARGKFARLVAECATYLARNADAIPHYGERYRYDEPISTAFVESAVNVMVDKRMSKRQQMHWTRDGAHDVLVVRADVLNGTLRDHFELWYPGMAEPSANTCEALAA